MHKKIAECIKKIGFSPNVHKFQHRIILQKVIYLLQLAGIKFGFQFGLYIRGPYSPELANCLFNKLKFTDSNRCLTKREQTIVKKFKAVFPSLDPKILEIAATYAYFAFQKKQDFITAAKNLKRIKPFFSESDIAVGISKAKLFLYNPSRKEVNATIDEFKDFENICLLSLQK